MKRFEGKSLAERLAAGALMGSLIVGAAHAGDVLAPMEPAKTPDNAHCRALGEGFFAVAGSDACIRISGYVAAGAEFGGGLRQERGPAPFNSVSSTHTRVGGGVSLDARFDTPMGPGRIYVDVGHDNFAP